MVLNKSKIKKKVKTPKKSSDTAENLPPLSEQFERPLDMVPALTVSSLSEVEQLFTTLEMNLKNKDDWTIRSQALQDLMSYLKGGVTKFADPNMFASLAEGIASCITDLRSALVRWGSLFVAAAAQTMQEQYVSSMEILVPALFKQLTHGTAIIANSCHYGLLEIAKNVAHRRTARVFLSNQKSKSNIHRQVVAEAIQIMTELWPNSLLIALTPQFTTALKVFAEDASPQVRKISRETTEYMSKQNPTHGDRPSSQFSPRTPTVTTNPPQSPIPFHSSRIPITPSGKTRPKGFPNSRDNSEKNFASPRTTKAKGSQIPQSPQMKHREKHQSLVEPLRRPLTVGAYDNSPDREIRTFDLHDKLANLISADEDDDIDSFMPPKTVEYADCFHEKLDDITRNREFSRLNGLEVLITPSILSALQFKPDIKFWKKSLSILFVHFKDIFREQVIDLLVGFDYNTWLMQKAITSFGLQEMISDFQKSSHACDLFISLLQCTNDFEITPHLNKFLKKLIEDNPNKSNISVIRKQILIEPELEESSTVDDENDNTFSEDFDEDDNSQTNTNPFEIANDDKSDDESTPDVNELIRQICEENDPERAFEHLCEAFINRPADSEIENTCRSAFVQIVKNETKAKKTMFMNMCITVLQVTKNICFITYVDLFTQLLIIDDKPLNDMANDCLLIMLGISEEFVSYLMKLTATIINENENEGIALLMIFQTFFSKTDSGTIMKFAGPLMTHFKTFLGSSFTSIRRIVVLIFVEFNVKAPKAFRPYLGELNSTQQKLIDLYSSKRGGH